MKRRVMMGKEKIKFPEEGLLHYWALNGNAVDSKGGANGNTSGVNWISGVNKNAANFKTGGYISVPLNINISAYSVSFWMNLSVFNQSDSGILFNRVSIPDARGLSLLNDTGDHSTNLLIHYGNGYITVKGSGLDVGKWYHSVVTVGDGYMRWYLNGTLYAQSYASSNLILQGSSCMIGRDDITYANGQYYERTLKGALDEMGIWNRILSTNEVQLLYNQGKGLFYE